MRKKMLVGELPIHRKWLNHVEVFRQLMKNRMKIEVIHDFFSVKDLVDTLFVGGKRETSPAQVVVLSIEHCEICSINSRKYI